MRKKASLVFMLILLFCLNISVFAEEDIFKCTNEELTRIKEIAKRVEINYDYEFKEIEQNGSVIRYPVYSLNATNLNNEIKVLIINDYLSGDYKEFIANDKSIGTLNGFSEGEKVIVTIKAYTPNDCSGKTVLSQTIKLPYYNNFSENGVCAYYPEFKYCAEFIEKPIDKETFENELYKYLDSLTLQENTNETNEGNWTLLIIIGAIVGVLALILIISTIVVRVRKKSEL